MKVSGKHSLRKSFESNAVIIELAHVSREAYRCIMIARLEAATSIARHAAQNIDGMLAPHARIESKQ